jgi:hypothetical protein
MDNRTQTLWTSHAQWPLEVYRGEREHFPFHVWVTP